MPGNFEWCSSGVQMKAHPHTWDDMSNYVVHFTRGGGGRNDYETMMSIYASRILKAGRRFGIGKEKAPVGICQEAVCFSEIPPGQWQRLAEQRETKYGLAFTKQFIRSRGGGPIWYVWKGTLHWRTLQDMMTSAAGDAGASIWKLTPMIDAPGDYGETEYYFDWEREWRHIGSMAFSTDDVAFLLIPEELHSSARSFFETARYENLGPAYLCPYVDPSWSKVRIINELKR
jgi:hypothetical protein